MCDSSLSILDLDDSEVSTEDPDETMDIDIDDALMVEDGGSNGDKIDYEEFQNEFQEFVNEYDPNIDEVLEILEAYEDENEAFVPWVPRTITGDQIDNDDEEMMLEQHKEAEHKQILDFQKKKKAAEKEERREKEERE